ncbi:DUF4386 domain-containing protein [Micromonospora sp. CV4]|uniref:DUF4386 domain-containing protein n=1 Tax=Micromonospora sp. CV4 TaxID=2478711 RepID=UPI000EF4F4BD|nr:DUF4386 domain-containing protein [Micromonospora sp. CV4]RLP86771.1 DUF4386 domain-containing protein [Micromonospora sp. CV4]
MSSRSRTATVAGVLFLITEIAGITGLALYQPVLSNENYVGGAGADTRVLVGAFSELIVVMAVIGTAVTLYPVIKRQNEGMALAHVCGRLLEAAVITVGIVSVVSIVTLRQDGVGPSTDDGALAAVGQSLVAIHDWTFLLGSNVILGVNSLLLAYLVYRSQAVPRIIAVLGLIGGPLVTTSAVAVMFGLYSPLDHAIAALPVFAWEVSLAVHLIVKGFRSPPANPRNTGSVAATSTLSQA